MEHGTIYIEIIYSTRQDYCACVKQSHKLSGYLFDVEERTIFLTSFLSLAMCSKVCTEHTLIIYYKRRRATTRQPRNKS